MFFDLSSSKLEVNNQKIFMWTKDEEMNFLITHESKEKW